MTSSPSDHLPSPQTSKIVVLGAGIVGLLTAYELAQRGHAVTVLEQNSGVAQQDSFGHAGLIAAGAALPFGRRELLRAIGHGLITQSTALRLLPPWQAGGQFLQSLSWLLRARRATDQALAHAQALTILTKYSGQQLERIRQLHDFDDERQVGLLQLFRTEREFNEFEPWLNACQPLALRFEVLTPEQTRAREPDLAANAPLTQAIHWPDAEAGNNALFARRLRETLRELGVQFHFQVSVERLLLRQNELVGVKLSSGQNLAAPNLVIAAGHQSGDLLAPTRLRLPQTPIQAYSLTLNPQRGWLGPQHALLDASSQSSITRLGPWIRISGQMELGAAAASVRPGITQGLDQIAQTWFAPLVRTADAQVRGGTQLSTPDGLPLIGATPIQGLWLNCAHGRYGWALAAGSARLLAEQMGQQNSEIDHTPYSPKRFAR